MPRKKKTDATGASTGNPASSTASQRPAKRQVASRFQAMATPARLSPATNAEQNLPAAASQPATAATREPETASVEPLTMFPGALFSGAAAISTVEMTAVASTVTLDPGLAAVDIRIPPIQPYTLGQVSLPLIWLSQPAAGERDRVQIFSASGRDDNWLPPSGDLIVVRSPPTGGQLTVTVFGPPGQPVQAASITVRRLTRAELTPTSAASAPMAPARTSPEKDVRLEVLAHIERRGDQIFPGTGWVGNRGSRLRIEGFVIRPLNELTSSDIEYQMLGPDGSEGPWVRSPQFCGTRGRGLRITGFAVRVSPRLQDRVAVEYYGAFFDSGISGPFKNGEACQPSLPGDTLEAINVRVTRRG